MTDTITLDTAFWISAGSILGLLVLSAFFSGSETTDGRIAGQVARAGQSRLKRAEALALTEDGEG